MLAATVAERLRQAIIDAELPLGSELSEVGLAERLGVSRTPVREALSLLQLQGMVNIIPQRGSYVFFPTQQDLVDLCEYRIVIELRAVTFSISRQRDETLIELRETVAAMEAAREVNEPLAYCRADTAFHETFIKNCRNRYLQEGYALAAGPIATLRTHFSGRLMGRYRTNPSASIGGHSGKMSREAMSFRSRQSSLSTSWERASLPASPRKRGLWGNLRRVSRPGMGATLRERKEVALAELVSNLAARNPASWPVQ